MTDAMTVNYLFFLGILIPCIITIVLFIVFIYCMRKFRIRREIMTKKHDPHGRLRKLHGAYAPPPPPLPPMWSRQSVQFKQKDRLLCERDNEAYDEAGEISQDQAGNHQLYQTCNDSGMSDLSAEAQYRYDQERPYSQSSTDSEDSGFRSSRSGQYLHSAQNSNTQDMPLFKPIKSHRESLTMTVHQGCSSKQPSPSHRANSNCDFCRSSSRQSRQRQSRPSSRRKVCDRPSSTLHQTPSPNCTKLDPITMTFISNSSPSTMDLLPPPHHNIQYKKSTSPEAIDLQQIETDVKLSHIPSISQQCRPLTMTTAIVHAPLHHYPDNTPRMSYSVV